MNTADPAERMRVRTGHTRLGPTRPGDGAALMRLARRLGEAPQPSLIEKPAPNEDTRRQALVDQLAADPDKRAEAALAKCEALLRGRELGMALATASSSSAAADGAAEAALSAAVEAARSACAAEGCPHRRAGLLQSLAPFVEQTEQSLAARRRAHRNDRLLGALREILADEIDARRQNGVDAERAAALLLERRDLSMDLPVSQGELAQIGVSIAAEAAIDPPLARALLQAALQIAEASDEASRAALREAASAVEAQIAAQQAVDGGPS